MSDLLIGSSRFKQASSRLRLAAVVAGVALLAGCSTLSLESAPRIYDLRAPADIEVGQSRTGRQLLVADPAAVRFYATARIVVRDSEATLAYFPGALWSDALPDLVQARFAEALERTGRARAVGRPGQGLLIDTQLVPEIRAFEVVIGPDGTAVAVVDIALKVMNDANGRILASRDFGVQVPAATDSVDDSVAALNAALDAALRDMVVFVLDAV
ncbi:MAG: ABC-type transport auxiliary lipoprotein family protein [Cohaesibacteraceae bacterium]